MASCPIEEFVLESIAPCEIVDISHAGWAAKHVRSQSKHSFHDTLQFFVPLSGKTIFAHGQ